MLTGLTLALGVPAVRDRLRTRSQAVNVLAAPLAITAAIALCCAVIGAPRHARWVAYGYVYQVTRRITASAVTHALVDWIWVLLLRGSFRRLTE